MRYLLALLFGAVSISGHANLTLQPGVNELQTAAGAGKRITVRIDVASPMQEHCASWRWGAEALCPKLAIAALQVSIDNESLFIPRSAFIDLGSPNLVTVEVRKSGFDVIVRGGDAATSYTATLRFRNSEIESRRVESGEFPDSAWEHTRFSFTK